MYRTHKFYIMTIKFIWTYPYHWNIFVSCYIVSVIIFFLGDIGIDLHVCHNFYETVFFPLISTRQHGEFCEFHVQAAYKKMRSQRMECQAGYE